MLDEIDSDFIFTAKKGKSEAKFKKRAVAKTVKALECEIGAIG